MQNPKKICFYFQAHQPFRIKPFTFFQLGNGGSYFNDDFNAEVVKRVSEKCYLPFFTLLQSCAQKHNSISFTCSITGTLIEQWKQHVPKIIPLITALVASKTLHLISETYHHSLAWTQDITEFEAQIQLHTLALKENFSVEKPSLIFRNTELIYQDALATWLFEKGYKAVLVEGVESSLKGQHPNQSFLDAQEKIFIFPRNYELSDDIAFRFRDPNASFFPLDASKFSKKLLQQEGNQIHLFMDIETFGEHQKKEEGIFEFFEDLINQFVETGHHIYSLDKVLEENKGVNPKVVNNLEVNSQEAINQEINNLGLPIFSAPHPISWADTERDLSAWLSNSMQLESIQRLYQVAKNVKSPYDNAWLDIWRKLQTSDHLYYMCTKYFHDGDIHQYFSPYASPYDAYIYFMNVLSDLEIKTHQGMKQKYNPSK